jgi:hypothetical protein
MQIHYQMDISKNAMENLVDNKMCVLASCELHKRRAQRDSAEKTSKFGLNECSIQNEKLPCTYIIYESVLIIDCHWHGFGGIRDRFDSILPPDFILSIACY